MLCVTSCFNKTLFKKNLQRFWPLWLGYALIWFVILPLIQFSDLLYGHMNGNTLAVSRTILEVSVVGGLIMGAGFGLLFAMAEFSYLTNGRATQGLHALSARRETFYITNYLSGLFCQLSTLAATFVLTGVITLFNLTFDLSALVRGFLICTLFVVFFYSFGVFCMMFSGQALAAPVFYGILNFLSIAMETLLRTFAGSFLYGYNDSLNEMYTDFLCPVWMVADNVDIRTIHETQPMLNNAGVYEMQHVTVGYELEGFGIILAYALVGVVLAVLGLLVYRRRASEETGTVVAIPWARPIFKYGVALCAAFSAGQLLYTNWLNYYVYQTTPYDLSAGVES
jgi:ABC-2 type transport system permease protein